MYVIHQDKKVKEVTTIGKYLCTYVGVSTYTCKCIVQLDKYPFAINIYSNNNNVLIGAFLSGKWWSWVNNIMGNHVCGSELLGLWR